HIGGQLAAHQVCTATNDAAFGSLAYSNGIAYVPCSDGIAAVNISLNDFSSGWYNQTNAADRPPTLAGGLVWSVATGGSNLLGLDAGNGSLVDTIALPNGSTHFTTAAAANGQIFV